MSFILDSTDKRILKHLIKDSRVKVVDIAIDLGVTSAAIHQRLTKIKKGDIIKEFTLRLNEKKVGYKTCAFVGVFIDKTGQYREVITKLEAIKEVVEAHYTTGKYGLFIKIYTKNNDHLMKVLNEQIQQIKGITRTETLISLEEPINRSVSL